MEFARARVRLRVTQMTEITCGSVSGSATRERIRDPRGPPLAEPVGPEPCTLELTSPASCVSVWWFDRKDTETISTKNARNRRTQSSREIRDRIVIACVELQHVTYKGVCKNP